MRKVLAVSAAILLAASLTACSLNGKSTSDEGTAQTRETAATTAYRQTVKKTLPAADFSDGWREITADGVDIVAMEKNADGEIIKSITAQVKAIVREQVAYEQAHPESFSSDGYARVFETEGFKQIVEIGESAMKPLYVIIYKSNGDGMFEHICATALYRLSGLELSASDGTQNWTTGKEFVERFNEKICSMRADGS